MQFYEGWPGRISLIRWHVIEDLEKCGVSLTDIWEVVQRAYLVRWVHICCAEEIAERAGQLEWRERKEMSRGCGQRGYHVPDSLELSATLRTFTFTLSEMRNYCRF